MLESNLRPPEQQSRFSVCYAAIGILFAFYRGSETVAFTLHTPQVNTPANLTKKHSVASQEIH